MKDYLEVLKNKNFIFIWNSQIFSQLTIQILNFLFLIELYKNTNSTIATSFLWIFYSLPAILIGPFASAAVDLIDRKKVLVITNLLEAVVIFLYASNYNVSLFFLYAIVLIYSSIDQFYVPAEFATLPSVVDKKSLPVANGLFFLTQQIAVVVGIGAALPMSSLIGFKDSVYICSLFLLWAFFSVNFLPKDKPEVKHFDTYEENVKNFFANILEGYSFIKNNRFILFPFILLLFLQLTTVIMIINIPVIALQIFAINIESSGFMIIVPAILGALFSTLIVPKLLKRGTRKIKVIKLSMIIFLVGVFSLIFIIPHFKFMGRNILSAFLLFLTGSGFSGILIPTQTFLQENTPGGLRGRVFGNFWFISTVISILPVLFSGAITEVFGVKVFFAFFTAIYLAIYIFVVQKGEYFIRNNIYGK